MITKRPAAERGHANHGWLDTWHTFSFAGYRDPDQMGFRALRVINEDRVQPGQGFGTHPHDNMEIITFVLSGALAHKDSMGNGSTIRPGDVQRMSAGTGITHSEFNASRQEPVHLYQIWIIPQQRDVEPSCAQQHFPEEEKRGRLRLVVSRDGRDGSLSMHRDVDLYAAILEPGHQIEHRLRPQRHAWVQVLRGAVKVNGHQLTASDGAGISEKTELTIRADEPSELLLFDLD